jgi:two-component system sensor histidine kinase TorS
VDWASPSGLTVAVADEGPAPSAADQIRIFEPFDRGGARDPQGLGVGLFLARRLARAMGGDLVLRDLGRGKAFVLTVEAIATTAPAPPRGGLEGLRILLVDDVDLTRRSLSTLLIGQGAKVVAAESAETAMRVIGSQTFDLLLLDQRLGDKTGLDVAAMALARSPRPRVLLMTGEATPDLVDRAQALGVDRVLSKPVSLHDIIPAASNTLPNARIDVLKGALGAEAYTLLSALKPAVESEIQALATSITRGDTQAAASRLHRLRGLAAHFGLESLARALDTASPRDGNLPSRLNQLAEQIDWPAPS